MIGPGIRTRATRPRTARERLAALMVVSSALLGSSVPGPVAAAPAPPTPSAPTPTEAYASPAFQEWSSSARYRWPIVGDASARGGSYHVERTRGARIDVRFSGTSIAWHTVKGPGYGVAAVYIDGDHKATLDLYAPTKTFVRIARPEFQRLGSGTHLLRIWVAGRKGTAAATATRVAVDAIEVDGRLNAAPVRMFWRSVTDSAAGVRYATANVPGAQAVFRFRGGAVDWHTVVGPDQGKANVYIDGKLKATVDNYAATRAYGVRRRFGGLSDAVHTLRVVVLAQKRAAATDANVAVDGWSITTSYTRNLAVRHVRQETSSWCVPASVQMELRQKGFSAPSQETMYYAALSHKRCNPNIDSGLDPQSWAWLLWRYTPEGYTYDDYTFGSAYSGTRAMIRQLYVYNEVAGALVNKGHHAMVFKGATTSCDPSAPACAASSYAIRTVYVDDPWYDRSVNYPSGTTCNGRAGSYTCGRIGLRPNSAITWSTWSRYYYTTWGKHTCYVGDWEGRWMSVLRKPASTSASAAGSGAAGSTSGSTSAEAPVTESAATAAKGDAPTPLSTAGPEFAAPAAPRDIVAGSASLSDLDAAFQRAVDEYGLARRAEHRPALDGGRLTGVLPVRSLSDAFPDYLLATVTGRNGTRAVAMFTLEGDRPTFAGMTYSDTPLARFPRLSPNAARQAVTATGNRVVGDPELAWGWSRESNSPYYPFYRVPTSAGDRFVSLSAAAALPDEALAPEAIGEPGAVPAGLVVEKLHLE